MHTIIKRKEVIIKHRIVHEEKTCNKCGKTFTKKDEKDLCYDGAIQNIKIDFGYGSDFDGSTWDMDICDECLFEFAKQCRHEPEGF